MSERSILIVEDDLLVARSIEVNLKRLGYVVPPAVDNATAALEAVTATPPDLILMDVRLQGGMDGIDIAQKIGAVADIPIVYTTAYADEQTIDRAKITQPFGYLVKPFGIKELGSVIEIAFYKHQMEQQLMYLNQVLRAVRHVNQLITQEHDPEKLLVGVCNCLVDTRGYRGAWIVRADAAGNVLQAHQAGVNGDFEAFSEALRQGYRPPCWERVLLAPDGNIAIELCDCLDCGFPAPSAGYGRLVARLEHDNVRYGFLATILPIARLQNEEERTLFEELAGDIAFALHNIEAEARRAHAEQALRASEQKFRKTVANLDEGYYSVSLDGVVLDHNRALSQILGFPPDKDLRGLNLTDFWQNPFERQKYLEAFAATGVIAHYQADLKTQAGTAITVLLGAHLVYDQDQHPLRIEGVLLDITARRQMEETLHRNAERLRSLVGILQYQAPNEQALLDFALQEATTLTGSQFGYIYLYDEDAQQFVLNSWSKEVMAACTIQDPQTCYELDKTGIWGEAVRQRQPLILNDFAAAHPLKQGYPEGHAPLHKYMTLPVFSAERIVAVVGVANKADDYDETDLLQLTLLMDAVWKVVERNRTQEALWQSKTLLDAAGRMARFGGWRVNLATNKVTWSDQVAAIHEMPSGYAPSVAEGINFYALEWQDRITQVFGACVREGQPYDEELEIVTARGNRVWVRTTGQAVRDVTGAIVSVEGAFQDISARKHAETTLQASEIRYRRLFESAKDGILILDADTGQIIDANPFLVDLLGYSRMELLDREVWEIGAFKDILASQARFAELREQGYVRYEDLPLETSDGRTIDVEFVSNSYLAGQAKVMQCNIRDITERKQAEDALTHERILLRTVIDNLPSGVYVKDLEARKLLVNRADLQNMGLDPQTDVLGRTDFEVFARDVAEQFYRDDRTVMDTGLPMLDREERLMLPSGEERWLLTSKVPLRDNQGQVVGLVGIGRDITERKQARETMRALKEFNEGIIQNMSDGIVVTDAAGQITFVNMGLAAMLGYAPEDLLGRLWSELVAPEHHPIALAVDARRQQGTSDRYDLSLLRQDGAPLTVLISGGPSFSPQTGEYSGTLGVVTDITERKAMEESLRESHQSLAAALHDLQNTQERLVQQERLAAIGQLAAGVAHDFNNVLAVIQLYTEIAQQSPDVSRSVALALKTVMQQARRGADLVQQILDFARRAPLKRQTVILHELLSEITVLLKKTLPGNIRVTLEVSPEEHYIDADPTRVQQALLNLALNARDAMPGGGSLHFKLDKLCPELGHAMPLPELEGAVWERICVCDSGSGIAPELLPRIFEPFFTTKAAFGTGLGLSQVEGIVVQHGGRVVVESQVDQGTTFTLYWPALEAPMVEPESEGASSILTGQDELILVVEDDLAMRTALVACLEMLNYQVLEAPDGEAALALFAARADDIALVISDWMMPAMNGVELVRELQRLWPAVKCLLLTGYFPGDIGFDNFAIEWVLKPPTVESLATAIKRVMQRNALSSA